MFNLRFNQHEENNQQKCCVELEYQVYCQVLSAHSAEGWFLDVLDREQGSVSSPESWDKRRIRASLLRSLYSQAFQGPPKLGLATTQGDVRHCMCQRDQSRAPWLWASPRWLTTVQMYQITLQSPSLTALFHSKAVSTEGTCGGHVAVLSTSLSAGVTQCPASAPVFSCLPLIHV